MGVLGYFTPLQHILVWGYYNILGSILNFYVSNYYNRDMLNYNKC